MEGSEVQHEVSTARHSLDDVYNRLDPVEEKPSVNPETGQLNISKQKQRETNTFQLQ